MDPLWQKDGPPKDTNPAVAWLWQVGRRAQLMPSSELPGFFDYIITHNLTLDEQRSAPGHLFCKLFVDGSIVNRYNTLHGGAIGSLVELMGSLAIRSALGRTGGMVTDVNISYIGGTPVGEEVEFEAKALKVGNSISVASVDIRNIKSGKASAQGRVTMSFQQVSKL